MFYIYIFPMLFILDIILSAIIVYFLRDFKYKKTVVTFFILIPCIVGVITMLGTLFMVEKFGVPNNSLISFIGFLGYLGIFLFLFGFSKLFFTLLYYINKKINEKKSYFFKLGRKKIFYFLKSTKYIGFLTLLGVFLTIYYFIYLFSFLWTFDVTLM